MKSNDFRSCVILLILVTSCISEQAEPSIDCTLNPVEVSLVESVDVECGQGDGSFSVLAVGGEPPYQYQSSIGANTNGLYSNLEAGLYSVVATDAQGCSGELNVSILNIDGVNLNQVQVSNAGCGTSNGTIQISAAGGEEPYEYRLNGGSPQTNNTFSSLDRGTYSVSVTDQAGCESSESVEILSGVSYDNSIKSIISNSCAVSGCHNGTVSPDLRSFSTIQARASAIKSRTGNGSMPKNSSLSDQQIELIACWVDDGAPNN